MNSELITRSEWLKWRQKLMQGAPLFESSQVSSRDLSLMFGDFCRISGAILDVGSGPKRAPYLERARSDQCIGLDPLPAKEPGFDLVCGVGEFLPFKNRVFDQCLCGTSLDHCVRPEMALKEMRRVIKQEGKVNLWIGTFDRPNEKAPTMNCLSQDAHEAWNLVKRRDFWFLARAVWVRLSRKASKVVARTKDLLGIVSDPYHLYRFHDKDIYKLLVRVNLSVINKKKLQDGSLFLSVR